jgi:hypothetical protein
MEPEKKIQIELPESSVPIKLNAVIRATEDQLTVETYTAKDFLVFQLQILKGQIADSKKITAKEKAIVKNIDRSLQFLVLKVDKLTFVKIEPEKRGVSFTYSYIKDCDYIEGEAEELLESPGYPIPYLVTSLLYPGERLKGIAPKPTVIERLQLHKQPRSLLKTVAQRIGNTTESPGVFTLPETIGASENIVKDELSKNTGALALYLMQLYQQNNNKALEISNLAPLSERLNCNNHRLKLFLLYLGGYTYPIVDKDEKTKELILTNEQLFKIEFRYSQAVANKYEVRGGEIQGVERVGTSLVNFIKDEPISRVIITPSERFIRALEGKGLGNILTVNDTFVSLILELTDIATKILTYSSSNRPSQTIAEDNLIKHLGLIKQIKTQGRPRVRATILKGLQELMDKGHIKNYNYEDSTGYYTFTYSDKYVKFKENKRGKGETL